MVHQVHSPAELTATFRAQGLKVTPQRQLLFRLLHDNATHPTAEAVYAAASAQMPGISLRTVYQTLSDLAAMGELHVLELGTGSARFDPNVADHHHVVCHRCGEIHDVYIDNPDALRVHGLSGFTVEQTAIVFRGRCARCAATPSPTTNPPHHQE